MPIGIKQGLPRDPNAGTRLRRFVQELAGAMQNLMTGYGLTQDSEGRLAVDATILASYVKNTGNIALTDQTAAIGETDIYTPTEAGDYQVSVNLTSLGTATTGEAYVEIFWTDDNGDQQTEIEPLNMTLAQYAAQTFLIHATTEPISYAVVFDSITGPVTYNAYVNVTRQSPVGMP